MVFFTCNSCGACLKKPAVAKHQFQCRGPASYTCMDCHKDFCGDEYKAHIKCITEEEKYSGTGWKAPAGHLKGEKKQQAWIETIQKLITQSHSTLDPMANRLLKSLTKHDNVPRKKQKFMNFIGNVSKNYFGQSTIECVWSLLEIEWKPTPSQSKSENAIVDMAPDTAKKFEDQIEESVSEQVVHKKKKKSKRQNEEIVVDLQGEEESVSEEVVPKKKKTSNRRNEESVLDLQGEEFVSEEVVHKKKKKSKRQNQESVLDTQGEEVGCEEVVKKKKKKSEKIEGSFTN